MVKRWGAAGLHPHGASELRRVWIFSSEVCPPDPWVPHSSDPHHHRRLFTPLRHLGASQVKIRPYSMKSKNPQQRSLPKTPARFGIRLAQYAQKAQEGEQDSESSFKYGEAGKQRIGAKVC